MKKCMVRSLALALGLCMLAGAALAANTTIITEPETGSYRSVTGNAVVGDTVYFLVYTHEEEEIWRWQEGMPEAEKAAGGLKRASNYGSLANAEEELGAEAAKYAVSVIFSDGERLMGLNHLNGLIYEIGIKEGKAVFTDIVQMKDTSMLYWASEGERWYWSPMGVVASGGCLYWHSSGWNEQAGVNQNCITRISLEDGSIAVLPVENAGAICGYKDGTLLYISRDTKAADDHVPPYDVYVYNPVTDSAEKVGSLDSQRGQSRIVYSAELDAVLWQDGTEILGMRNMGEVKRYAYVSTSVSGRMAVVGDILVHTASGRTIARDLKEGMTAPESLQVLGGSESRASRSFMTKYPDVPIVYVNDRARATVEEWVQALAPLEEGETTDVLLMHTASCSWVLDEMKEGALLYDLSENEEIRAYVEALYPPFRDLAMTEDGKIVAVPLSTSSYSGFFINRRAMQELGLTVEDMPANMVDLCAFLNRWNDEFALQRPYYACIEYTEDTKAYMLNLVMEMWISYCQATEQPLHFDDPVFREMMAALETLRTENTDAAMKQTNPEISDYKTGLIWMNCQLVGNWASYMEDYSDRIFIPMTLTKDTPFFARVDDVELRAVNANTENPEYAMKLICEEIAAVNDKYRHVLLTTETQEVESEYYAEQRDYMYKRLEDLKAQLAAAQDDMEKQNIQAAVDEQQYVIDTELQRMRYSVSGSAVRNYVEVLAPGMYIHHQNQLEDTTDGRNALIQLQERWLKGMITTQQMITEADARLLMLEMAK